MRTETATAPPPAPSPGAEADDRQLVVRARGGDDDAFATLVERHQDAIVNYLARLTGDRDRAEDLGQETFVRLYQSLDRYRDDGHLPAYLFRIATNLVRSEERRRRRFRLLAPFLVTPDRSADPGPGAAALAREARSQVAAAVESLDLRYRAPLVLREIEGMSYGEVASALELSEGTVKSRIHRARRLLRRRLEPFWNGNEPCLTTIDA